MILFFLLKATQQFWMRLSLQCKIQLSQDNYFRARFLQFEKTKHIFISSILHFGFSYFGSPTIKSAYNAMFASG